VSFMKLGADRPVVEPPPTRGLIEGGVPCIHFYVMNDAAPAVEIVRDPV